MRRKILALAVALTVIAGLSTSVLVKAAFSDAGSFKNVVAVSNNDEDINESKRLLEEALKEKKFYKYNIAYASIDKIKDENVKGKLMGELASIANVIYSDEINKFNKQLIQLVETKGNGKLYDEIEADLRKSTLYDLDREYLLGELTGWGKNLVYTTDYQLAVEKVVYAWDRLLKGTDTQTNYAIAEAEKAIKLVKNKHSKDYLSEQLDQIRQQTEFTVIDIN
jgi:hypothetical protein